MRAVVPSDKGIDETLPVNPSVAIVTRTKNRPLLLDRAIRSVMQQTLQDLQMVIVNDGGDRTSVDAVITSRRDEARGRIMVIHHDESQGMEAASNVGILASDSRYVAILDDDDSWHPRFLELTTTTAEHSGSMGTVTDARVVIEATEYGDIRLSEWFDFDPTAGPWMARRPPTDLFRLISWNQFPPCSFVYRRAVLDEVGLYDETLPVLGDWDFNLRVLLRYPIDYLPQPLAYYHHRADSDDKFGNSVHSNEDLHEKVRIQLLDRYFRADLDRGILGVGFLSNLLYDLRQTRTADRSAYEDIQTRLSRLEKSVSTLDERLDGTLASLGAMLKKFEAASFAMEPRNQEYTVDLKRGNRTSDTGRRE